MCTQECTVIFMSFVFVSFPFSFKEKTFFFFFYVFSLEKHALVMGGKPKKSVLGT